MGFTIAELTVALALLGVLIGLALHTLSAHQKVFRNFNERVLRSEQLREGELALATDIRGSAVTSDTLRLLADSAFEFFATIGSGVVCTLSAQTIALVPSGLSSGFILTSLPLPPDTGDLLVAYSAPDSLTGARRWVRFRISSVTSASASSACPATTGFTAANDLQKSSVKMTLAGATAAIAPGAPVRIVRRGRYSLYRSSEGDWYLGYKRCNALAPGCSTVQPVSGPYLPYSSSNGGGLRFRFVDAFGAAVPSTRPLDVASVEVTLRSDIAASGRSTGHGIDSALFLVSFRNVH
jgi:type II secretory pathway pseudopilin PulG